MILSQKQQQQQHITLLPQQLLFLQVLSLPLPLLLLLPEAERGMQSRPVS